MRIVQVVFSLASGGAERFVVNLSNELARSGHEVMVLTLREDSKEQHSFNRKFLLSAVSYYCLGFSSGFSLSMAMKLANYLKKEKFDIIHSHLSTLVAVPFLMPYMLKGEKNVVHTIHTVYKTRSRTFKSKIFECACSQRWLIPVAISRQCQVSCVEYFKLKKSELITNGCPTIEKSIDFEKIVAEVRSIKNGELVFIHVARFNKLKNQQLLVNAFNALYDEKIPFKLIVIGRDFDSPEAKPLVDSACQNIHFLGEKTNVGDYLACADAFCLTSDYEGLPISLLEALSAGVTPICTPVGGIPDVVTDGVTGYLSAGMTVDDYCDAVKRFIASPIDRELLKKYFLDNYSMTKCARQYEQLYNEIVDK